jgi:hypothetical protein
MRYYSRVIPILLTSSNACASAPPKANKGASKAAGTAALRANDQSVEAHSLLSGVPAATPIRPRDDFEKVSVWVLEIHTSPTVMVVDLARLGL